MESALVLCAFVHVAANVLTCGTLALHRALGLGIDEAARRLVALGAWVAFASAIAWWVLQAGITLDDPAAMFDADNLFGVLHETAFGRAWQLHLAFTFLLVLLVWIHSRARALLQLVAALALASLALVGHPAAVGGRAGALQQLLQAVHLLAAAGWVGALPTLWLRAWRTRATGATELAGVLHRFAPYGALLVATVLASGGVEAWLRLGGWRDLLAAGYGRVLAIKLALVALLLANALANRQVFTPRLRVAPQPGLRQLRWSLSIETALGLAILAAAALLANGAPPA